MYKLQSYVCGEWFQSSDDGITLRNAVNGDEVAQISSKGIDFNSMAEYARNVAGPKCRELTFHQRAFMLKALGQYLLERKEIFYECSKATGATRTDSWIDIEGGISTLFIFSGKGRREMPNSHIMLDGAQEQISRKGSFTGQHIFTPLKGVAVHINAYNFPCWGMLEKFAPTFLAGIPAIVKPGSQTAYLTELMVHHIIESNILPKGAIQLICGSAGDLLNYMTYQDVLSFTGSAYTGLKLKQSPAIFNNNTRFFMEADSLNCSILGRDAKPGTSEFDLFVKEVVREMTVKAGQKCTAIRRALVPDVHFEAVSQAITDRLTKVVVGNPDREEVKMGALAGLDQRDEVQEKLKKLTNDSEIVFGTSNKYEFIDADPKKGAFMKPTLLACHKPWNASVHDIEAFGPVSTLIPYHDEDEAIALAALGKGSLAGSVVTADSKIAQKLVLGLAPHHGRIVVINEECAKESTGHGSPLPHLIHGGPGRAGGSEEMGGIRGVKHYMQRTAIQGSPNMLTAITDVWIKGSERETNSIHPFKKQFDELSIGDSVVTDKRTITIEDIDLFAELSGDKFYAHMDEKAAKRNPFFEDRVAHGYFLVSMAAGLFVWPNEGPVLANYGLDNLRFSKPVYVGDTLHVQFTCKQKVNREIENYGEVRWDTTIVNDNGDLVANYDVLTLVAKNSNLKN